MQRHEFLRHVHDRLRPATYLEIGVNAGTSLALSRAKTIAIDPAFKIVKPFSCDASVFRTTSDEYFSRSQPLKPFGSRPIELSFIDGMHLFEFALRDFMNVEKHSDWATVIVFDDMLPRNVDEAARDRHTTAWTGDVYKVILTLRQYRPDLLTLPLSTEPTGLLLVLGADNGNRVLDEHYDEILERHVVPDPQVVPEEILGRRVAVDPQAVLQAPFWDVLTQARQKGRDRASGYKHLVRSVTGSFPEVAPRHPGRARRGIRRLLPTG